MAQNVHDEISEDAPDDGAVLTDTDPTDDPTDDPADNDGGGGRHLAVGDQLAEGAGIPEPSDAQQRAAQRRRRRELLAAQMAELDREAAADGDQVAPTHALVLACGCSEAHPGTVTTHHYCGKHKATVRVLSLYPLETDE